MVRVFSFLFVLTFDLKFCSLDFPDPPFPFRVFLASYRNKSYVHCPILNFLQPHSHLSYTQLLIFNRTRPSSVARAAVLKSGAR